MSEVIRLLLADDHAIIRKGLKAILEFAPDIKLVSEAANGLEAVQLDEELRPDVILMDLMMPELDGVEAIRRIKARRPEARILVLTTFAGDVMVFSAIKAGALGYHLKDSSADALIEAIRDVYRGQPSLHPAIARKVLEELVAPPKQPPTADPLTEREVEVLKYIAQGWENKEIAAKLSISEATVRTHVSNILEKLQLASRTQAALYALREGLTTLDP